MTVFDVLERNGYSTTYEIVANGIEWQKRNGYKILGIRELIHSKVNRVTHCEGNYIRVELAKEV